MKILAYSLSALLVFANVGLAAAAAPPPATQSGELPPPPGHPPMADDNADGPPPPPPHGRRPPPPAKAAHFRLENGDLVLDVKCAEDEPMHACADVTLQLLEKLTTSPKP